MTVLNSPCNVGITAAMEVWESLTDTEQGEVAITVETSTGGAGNGKSRGG